MRIQYKRILKLVGISLAYYLLMTLYHSASRGMFKVITPNIKYEMNIDGQPFSLKGHAPIFNKTELEHLKNTYVRYMKRNSLQDMKDRLERMKSVTYYLTGTKYQQTRYLTIGVPCVSQENGSSHLHKTMESIIENIPEANRLEVRIVILLTSADRQYNQQLQAEMQTKYKQLLKSGFMLIIEVPSRFYKVVQSLNSDSDVPLDRGSKSLLDMAFLIQTIQNISMYYLQLEDGISCQKGFFESISQFIDEQGNKTWSVLEFSNNDFLGKLFNCQDIEKFFVMLTTFYREQQIGELVHYYQRIMAQTRRIKYLERSLFYYIKKSSVYGFVETEYQLVSSKSNPAAYVFGTFHTLVSLDVRRTYKEEGYSWVPDLIEGDTLNIIFAKPRLLKVISIKTGAKWKTKDLLHSATVSICSSIDSFNLINKEVICSDSNLKTVGKFVKGKCDVNLNGDKLVAAVIVRVTKGQPNWVAFDYISVH